eukprot:5795110-Pyramimonas_sp.AAC.1
MYKRHACQGSCNHGCGTLGDRGAGRFGEAREAELWREEFVTSLCASGVSLTLRGHGAIGRLWG